MSIGYASLSEQTIAGQESLSPYAVTEPIVGPYLGETKEVVQKWPEDAYIPVHNARQIAP